MSHRSLATTGNDWQRLATTFVEDDSVGALMLAVSAAYH
jgi:hypothetical protein